MIKKVKRQLEDISPLETSELLIPHIDLCSNREANIEGCAGIIEYNSSLVRINCKKLIVRVAGSELTIRADNTDRISIYGNIISLDFTGA